jgi:hypothetical protein
MILRSASRRCGLPHPPSICMLTPILFFRERMYFATGFGLIQCVKALMSYEDDVRFIYCG